MTIDFRSLNDTIKSKNWPLPQIDILIQKIGKQRPEHIGVLDMGKLHVLPSSSKNEILE